MTDRSASVMLQPLAPMISGGSRAADVCLWPAISGRLTGPVDGMPHEPLTRAEARVLFLLRQGLSNKEIAAALGRTETTVKKQVSACLRKHRVPSRSRLVAVLGG